tara:strand:+ start:143 stop:340 length:198 start_codon:yes stop_codon:yes gene_type:complete
MPRHIRTAEQKASALHFNKVRWSVPQTTVSAGEGCPEDDTPESPYSEYDCDPCRGDENDILCLIE